ncbi:MAG TPA: glycosyltransferase [Saprospiraceae bacterium]|nr:glycosyltransferase [Saprospiraceae bacterium]
MSAIIGAIFDVLYLMTVALTTLYCFYNFVLAVVLLISKKQPNEGNNCNYKVTIQLPIYNEKNVVEDLYEHIDRISYPSDLLEIQILDDSTDACLDISKKWMTKWKTEGKDVQLIHRQNREGYKAGALAAGLSLAKGDYICIFDADFRPDPHFLKLVLPVFADANTAAVQARWTFANQGQNLLTRLQTLQLNIHFAIEQQARYFLHLPLQFNGTCGVWRKTAIQKAGGWEADTLTEDLDLSYRAQLKGWKIVYLNDVLVPGELPSDLRSLKIQQHRWMKGGAETAKKLIRRIWSGNFSLIQKISATLHLFSSSIYLVMFLMSIVTLPLIFLRPEVIGWRLDETLNYLPLTLFALTMIIANIKKDLSFLSQIRSVFESLMLLPFFVAFHLGFSFHNAKAVLSGWRGIKTPFNRTPKAGVVESEDAPNRSFGRKLEPAYAELILGIVFALSCFYDDGNHSFYHFHILCAIGYLSIFVFSFIQTNHYHED